MQYLELGGDNMAQTIELQSVTKFFGDFPVISNLNLMVPNGERVAIIGPNGAGKSTLLKLVAGLMPQDSGSIIVHGEQQTERNNTLKKIIAYFPDDPPLYDLLNAVEYLEYVAALWDLPVETSKVHISDLMEEYQLTHASQIWIKNFSRGMRQKLGLISVFFRYPRVLLLDEPFNALDTDAVDATIRILQNLPRNCNVFIVSHDLEILQQVTDRAIVMDKGQIIAELSSCHDLGNQYKDIKRRFQTNDASDEE